jgi:hypothetical protein
MAKAKGKRQTAHSKGKGKGKRQKARGKGNRKTASVTRQTATGNMQKEMVI